MSLGTCILFGTSFFCSSAGQAGPTSEGLTLMVSMGESG